MKRSALFVVTLTALVMATPVFAASPAQANLDVKADVVGNCTISTTAVSFGNYDPVSANATTALNATGKVTVTCTRGAGLSIDLGLGSNATGSTRRMTDGATTASFLTYELYSNSGRTTVWGTGTSGLTITAAPSIAPRNYTVYGTVAAGQDVPVGSYADVVVASINY
jgi:spore coat protein U-like protein